MRRRTACYVVTFFCIFYVYLKWSDDNTNASALRQPSRINLITNKIKAEEPMVCNDELMTYKHKLSNGTVLTGITFNCSDFHYLQQFDLLKPVKSQNVRIEDVTFVIGADATYYGPSRAVIAGIRNYFGAKPRIIYYDLGGTLDNPRNVDEMTGICNFDARRFDFNQLPENVRGLKVFAWKVLILAELYKEFKTFFYLDSSIFFESGDFQAFYDLINNGSITPFQMSGDTGHSIRHATNIGMYKYLPLDPTLDRDHDMLEANMMLIHKNDATREILKWAVLCAVTRDCIEPPGSVLGCSHEGPDTPEGGCNRQDQSIFNILVANLEKTWINAGRSVITHIQPNHPKNSRQRHSTVRMQSTREKIDTCRK
uniref:Nucleotide-diphospho-sugar transferase domain-containing protein n=1 Tax=Panagrellus redivivus TaxID=6233 RepID=A0A7E4UWR7_PANRE